MAGPVDALIALRSNIGSGAPSYQAPQSGPAFPSGPGLRGNGFDTTAFDQKAAGGVVGAAMQWRGTPYQWGGSGRGGIDCSGLVQQAYRAIGVNLPRTTYEQVRTGQVVAGINNARPGDAIFLHNNGHVGIYLGNGMMIDANHTGGWVDVRPISGYGSIAAIRRYT